jgi:hypothetical protein
MQILCAIKSIPCVSFYFIPPQLNPDNSFQQGVQHAGLFSLGMGWSVPRLNTMLNKSITAIVLTGFSLFWSFSSRMSCSGFLLLISSIIKSHFL